MKNNFFIYIGLIFFIITCRMPSDPLGEISIIKRLETINTGGNCGMALVQIARHILKIDQIGIIGLDLDNTTSYKNVDSLNELWLTQHKIVDDFLTMGQSVYNLTRMGNVHGKGIVETNIDDFLK